jgi:hypothetical protein
VSQDCTRHGYHLFLFRLEEEALGVFRKNFLDALAAEGIPCCAGYVMPLYRQPLFLNRAFGPYRGYQHIRPDLDYGRVNCPNCEAICSKQGAWLEQRLFLGTQDDMNDIAAAFEKVHACREQLAGTGSCTQGVME